MSSATFDYQKDPFCVLFTMCSCMWPSQAPPRKGAHLYVKKSARSENELLHTSQRSLEQASLLS